MMIKSVAKVHAELLHVLFLLRSTACWDEHVSCPVLFKVYKVNILIYWMYASNPLSVLLSTPCYIP